MAVNLNGTWTTGRPPKILQLAFGSLLIALLLSVGLVHGDQTAKSNHITVRASPSLSPSPPAASPRASARPVRQGS
jgi:hypothetical protein